MKKTCVVVDLEGTLSDCSHRLHLLEAKDYDGWNAGLHLDPPREDVIATILELSKVHTIFISTAKPRAYYNAVVDWLTANCRFTCTRIFMREGADNRSSPKVKADHIAIIHSLGYEVIEAFDDRLDVCAMYHKMYGIVVVHTPLPLADPDYPARPAHQARTVDQILKEGAEFFQDRAKEYGTAYLRHGAIMAAFFPDGITLKTADDFYFWHIFELDVIKSNRIASAMMRGEQHPDSWHDKMIYSAMATEGVEKCQK